jgi:hypothetical protein
MAAQQQMQGEITERIRARAYEIFESRQGDGGDELSDWLQAEREVAAGAGAGDRPDTSPPSRPGRRELQRQR